MEVTKSRESGRRCLSQGSLGREVEYARGKLGSDLVGSEKYRFFCERHSDQHTQHNCPHNDVIDDENFITLLHYRFDTINVSYQVGIGQNCS
jgi:hypothetical protein